MDIFLSMIGSMSSSEMRMTPRPPKTPAWSHGLMNSPLEDPSSGSDNASDNSDKIESYCQQTQIQTPNGMGAAGGNTGNKNRKRKIVGTGVPTFLTNGACSNDVGSGGRSHNENGSQQQQHQQQQQQQQQKDGNDLRSNQGRI
jgi:hypothetical protein